MDPIKPLRPTLPLTRDDFLRVFESYNQDIWPGQVILYLLGVVCLVLVFIDRSAARRTLLAVLGGLWLWMAIVYHMLYFTRISPAGWIFGALFVGQAVLLFAAALGDRPSHGEPAHSLGFGALLVLYAMVLYPIIGVFSDHAFPRSPTFGLPCPTTIFTFGILLLISQQVPWWLLALPSLWAIIGSTALFQFRIWEDFGLPVAAVITVAVFVAHSRRGAATVRPVIPV